MNKQTKQLAILGGLVVVAAIVAFIMYGRGDDSTAKPADNTAQNNAPPPPAPTQGGQAPAAGAPGAPAPAAGAPGAPVAVVEDLPIPPVPDKAVTKLEWEWKWPAPVGGKDYKTPTGQIALYDPLKVLNVDVVDPERRKVIDQLRQDWILDGITVMKQMIQEKDASGNLVPVVKMVKEAWFKGKKRPYKENDRLTNTRFTIKEIFKEKEREGIRLISDTGAEVEMVLAPATRYKDD